MSFPKRFIAVPAGVALSLLAFHALAQPPTRAQSPEAQSPHLTPRTAEEREHDYQNLHRVVLYLQVSDPSGKPETTLNQADFTVLVDDRPIQIAKFRSVQGHPPTDPPQVIIVLDAVNNSSGKVAHFRKEVEKYLTQGEGPLAYPMSIAVLSDSGMKIGTASTDRTALTAELNELAGNLHGLSCADTTHQVECNVPNGPGAPPLRSEP